MAILRTASCEMRPCVDSVLWEMTRQCLCCVNGRRPGRKFLRGKRLSPAGARLQKENKDITNQIASYLDEPHFPIRMASIFALGSRGDATAVPALEALLKSNDLSIEMAPMIKMQIDHLKNPGKGSPGVRMAIGDEGPQQAAAAKGGEDQRLSHLEQLVEEMNERLKTIESRLPAAAKP